MGMVVQHNMNALNAYNRLNANVAGLKKASEKLSSGYRINKAGDDAAGLAISEKMRSQIKGLNQATRNAQDGINMIQTFEGAAQETHSILQRMKELATESANGTYDNPTDRAAIELEFSQLNDELNQIADTDFNGTIVLNGGEMADGLKVGTLKDGIGEFNYAEAKDITPTDITTNGRNVTLSGTQSDAAGNVLNNSDYDRKSAAALWKQLGLDADTKEVNITFRKNGDKWEAVAASSSVTKETAAATASSGDVTALTDTGTTNAVTFTDTAALGKYLGDKGLNAGTITIVGSSAAGTADLTFSDGHNTVTVTNGDMANVGGWTINTGNGAATNYTATLAYTAAEAAKTETSGEKDITSKVDLKSLGITNVDAAGSGKGGFKVSWKDGDNSFDVNAVFDDYDAKNGDFITLKFDGPGTPDLAPKNIDVKEDSVSVKLDSTAADVTKNGLTEGAIKFTIDAGLTDDKMTKDLKEALDIISKLDITYSVDDAGTATLTAANLKSDGTAAAAGAVDGDDAAGGVIGIDADGKITAWNGTEAITLGTLAFDATKINGTIATGKTAEVKFNLKAQNYNFGGDKEIKANSVATSDLLKNAVTGGADVTKANAFKNSTARMTYADHIILQTGSRTKDAVDFTFKYNTDGTADMGTLKANLNLSSRADGLNTANLSLANQKDANYAIDQIDKAINKTSMVRATFGSIQNRLEHKITNLTTTSENLTEAESSIRDTDMASEMMNYTKFNILQQAAQSMLAQANQQPQSVLQLLG